MSSKLSSATFAALLVALLTAAAVGQTQNRGNSPNEAGGAAKTTKESNPPVTPKYTTPSNPLDAAYGAKIKEYTTEKYFMTELVDHLPASDKIPSPEKVLGYAIGTPGKLTKVADLNRYYRALAAASCASTSRMSGRCSSKSDGSPGEGRSARMPLRLPPRTVRREGGSPRSSASVAMFCLNC